MMTTEERKAKWREYSRRYYAEAKTNPERMARIRAKNKLAAKKYQQKPEYKARRAEIDKRRHERIMADPELAAKFRARQAKASRLKYRRIKADPDRYAKYIEMKQAWRNRNKDKINAKRNEWRKTHKRKNRLMRMRETSLLHLLWRECPEAYAMHRAKKRVFQAKYLRKIGKVHREYRPRLSFRIPDECSWGNVLDTRSVFLWNNQQAASLLAGREYQRMMWREAHCDRFGEVCR